MSKPQFLNLRLMPHSVVGGHRYCPFSSYIPLQHETTHIGVSRWSRPPMRRFCVAYINMLVFRNPCRPNTTPNLPNVTPNLPNASRWNIGRVGSTRVGSCIGHVDFILFVSISFVLGSQCEHGFRWNIGLKPNLHRTTNPTDDH